MKEEQESFRQATQESAAGQTRTTAEIRGEDTGWGRGRGQPEGSLILDGLACQVFFLMTSSWMGSRTALPDRYFLYGLVTGGAPHNGSQQVMFHVFLKLYSFS